MLELNAKSAGKMLTFIIGSMHEHEGDSVLICQPTTNSSPQKQLSDIDNAIELSRTQKITFYSWSTLQLLRLRYCIASNTISRHMVRIMVQDDSGKLFPLTLDDNGFFIDWPDHIKSVHEYEMDEVDKISMCAWGYR